mgnify:FL=1
MVTVPVLFRTSGKKTKLSALVSMAKRCKTRAACFLGFYHATTKRFFIFVLIARLFSVFRHLFTHTLPLFAHIAQVWVPDVARTIEWALDSPVDEHLFEEIPVIKESTNDPEMKFTPIKSS